MTSTDTNALFDRHEELCKEGGHTDPIGKALAETNTHGN